MKIQPFLVLSSIQIIHSLEHWIQEKDLEREVAQCPKLPDPIEKALKLNQYPFGANKLGRHLGKLKRTPNGQFIASFQGVDLQYLKNEKLLAAMLKIFWKPEPKVARNSGKFQMNLFEFKQSKAKKRMIDFTTLNYKNSTEDEGWYNFDVTLFLEEQKDDFVKFYIQKAPVKVKKDGKSYNLLPLGDISDVQLVIYTHGNHFRDTRNAKR